MLNSKSDSRNIRISTLRIKESRKKLATRSLPYNSPSRDKNGKWFGGNIWDNKHYIRYLCWPVSLHTHEGVIPKNTQDTALARKHRSNPNTPGFNRRRSELDYYTPSDLGCRP